MQPLLKPGQEVLAARRSAPKPGEVWVLRHPHQPSLKIVKSVTGVHPAGGFEVRGLNPARSEDSRQFGPAKADLFLGRVESIFWTPESK
jgi:nickel-type superoxide dismutase maturation protease